MAGTLWAALSCSELFWPALSCSELLWVVVSCSELLWASLSFSQLLRVSHVLSVSFLLWLKLHDGFEFLPCLLNNSVRLIIIIHLSLLWTKSYFRGLDVEITECENNRCLYLDTEMLDMNIAGLFSSFVLLLFYVLATYKVISWRVPTCNSVHSWWLYSAVPLRTQAVSTMIWYPIESHYFDTEPTSPCPILITPSTWLRNNKHKCYKLSVWLDHGFEPMISRMRDLCSTISALVSMMACRQWTMQLYAECTSNAIICFPDAITSCHMATMSSIRSMLKCSGTCQTVIFSSDLRLDWLCIPYTQPQMFNKCTNI